MINTQYKPRILLIGNFLSQSRCGSQGVCEDLSIRLLKARWSILTSSSQPQRLRRVVDMLLTIVIKNKMYNLAVVDVYSGAAFLWAEWSVTFLKGLCKPYILVLRGGGLADFAQKYPQRVRRLLQSARFVLTPSLFLQQALCKHRSDIQYLPNGLDLSNYPYLQQDHMQPKLIWLRALHKIYQPELAVQVLAMLKPEFPDIQLLMVGPDKHDGSRQTMEQAASSLGVEGALNWIGPIPKAQVPQILSQGGIFLNTTRFESFGVSVMEAAACGLPIVTTDAGELALLWQNGHDAMVVPKGDAQAMAAAVRRILTEPGLAEKLSVNARRKAESFDWAVILPQWESLFEKCLSGADRG